MMYCHNFKAYASGSGITNITVKVNVISAPCKINDGHAIEVDFGKNLRADLIDGSHYITPIKYSIDCSKSLNTALKMQIVGEPSSFDITALKVAERDNMGISIMSSNGKYPINTWLSFNNVSPPVLTAVPIVSSENKLTPGGFSAVATMKVDYE
ncbi:TPA: fimbrial protein [Enterobacter roggenkampii]|nr:fimbrial protein [Enterobacter roggenkampii]